MQTMKITLTSEMPAFLGPGGREIVYLSPWPGDGQILYRPERTGPHYALACWGMGNVGLDVDHTITVGNPHPRFSWIKQLDRKDPHAILAGAGFELPDAIASSRRVEVVGLPPEVFARDIFRFPDGRFILITGDASDQGRWRQSLAFFIGEAGQVMRRVEVTSVVRCCYGAFVVDTADQTLRITQWFGDRLPLWGTQQIRRFRASDVTIVSSPAGPTITDPGATLPPDPVC